MLTDIDKLEENFESIEDSVLELLQSEEYPLSKEKMIDKLERKTMHDIDKLRLKEAIDNLERRGYDIKKMKHRDKTKITLVRYAETDKKLMYKPLAKIETPVLMSGDWHIGHKGFSEQAFNFLVDDLHKYDIENLMLAGDILQGLGVHPQEAKDIIEPDIDSQIDFGVSYLEQIPDYVDIYATIGNHEMKLKGKHKVGFDILKALSNRVDNFSYFGSTAEFELNGKYRYLMMHGSGGNTYAKSYRLQKVWRSLPDPRPDIVHMGHMHTLQPVPMPPNKCLYTSGTLQRGTSYTIWKGHRTELGHYILNDYTEEGDDLRKRVPTVY